MVDIEQHQMLAFTQARQRGAHQRPARQIERRTRILQHHCRGSRFPIACRQIGQVHSRDIERGRLADYLHRHAVDSNHGGAQRFVAAHDFVDGCGQRVRIELTGQPDRHRDVVRRVARIDLIDNPQALLRIG